MRAPKYIQSSARSSSQHFSLSLCPDDDAGWLAAGCCPPNSNDAQYLVWTQHSRNLPAHSRNLPAHSRNLPAHSHNLAAHNNINTHRHRERERDIPRYSVECGHKPYPIQHNYHCVSAQDMVCACTLQHLSPSNVEISRDIVWSVDTNPTLCATSQPLCAHKRWLCVDQC